MSTQAFLSIAEIELRICDQASEALLIPRSEISPQSRLLEDLHCDSLCLLDLMWRVEKDCSISFPKQSPQDAIGKSLFTRQPFRISDLAEYVYLYQGRPPEAKQSWRGKQRESAGDGNLALFTQLDGCWQDNGEAALMEVLESDDGVQQFRRRSDGMRSALIPAAEIEIGSSDAAASVDEQPLHRAEVDAFFIDVEPVSTTAYCRFLNSIVDPGPEILSEWFVLERGNPCGDPRVDHALISCHDTGWRPRPDTEQWPMVLVSWYGANAYSLWANRQDWSGYREHPGQSATDRSCPSCLPTEAQWEYAARGAIARSYPWGDEAPSADRARFAQHHAGRVYEANTLPMAAVNERLGMSPFGLHHMAGNVWQWCRDWYCEHFYSQADARQRNPVNCQPSGVRSERGGSWVGPAELCRSSYRRGRPPHARGRCLGFRCVSSAEVLSGRA